MLRDKCGRTVGQTVAAAPELLTVGAETRASRALGAGTRQTILLPAALVLAAAAALSIDCPLSRWCMGDTFPECLRDVSILCEPFGNGLGVLIILLIVHRLDPARRYRLARVTACSLGAGMGANVVKLTIHRVRPHHFDFDGGVWATFQGWMPLLGAGSGGQSFPSAHTATAVGLAVALTWLYPRGRVLFPTLAVLVACQRIQGGAHFLSDVCCGAALGLVVAGMCLGSGRLAARFDRLERRWQTRADRSSPSGGVAASPAVYPFLQLQQEEPPARRAA